MVKVESTPSRQEPDIHYKGNFVTDDIVGNGTVLVVAAGATETQFTGLVIYSKDPRYPIGTYRADWIKTYWQQYTGEIHITVKR